MGYLAKKINVIPVNRAEDFKINGRGKISLISDTDIKGIGTKFISDVKKNENFNLGVHALLIMKKYKLMVEKVIDEENIKVRSDPNTFELIKKEYKGLFIEGIVITMTNAGSKVINSQDLLELVNMLRDAGVEAISINEQRIVYDSYIVYINGKSHIKIKGEKVSAPFTIKAIGNTTYLESAVAQKKYGYIDTKISEGKEINLERQNNITIAAHNKSLEYEYVKEED